MKPKAESKLLDVAIDGERGLERLRKLGRAILATPKKSARAEKIVEPKSRLKQPV
jgi:hypothetical protein